MGAGETKKAQLGEQIAVRIPHRVEAKEFVDISVEAIGKLPLQHDFHAIHRGFERAEHPFIQQSIAGEAAPRRELRHLRRKKHRERR